MENKTRDEFFKTNLFIVRIDGVPEHYIDGVSFTGADLIVVKFREGINFCAEKHFKNFNDKHNSTVAQPEIIKIEYVDKIASVGRVDTFFVRKITKIEKSTLQYDKDSTVTIDITFKIDRHDITTYEKGKYSNKEKEAKEETDKK